MPLDEFGREVPGRATAPTSKPETKALPLRNKPRHDHISQRYVEAPLLCAFLFNERAKDESKTYDEYRKEYCLDFVRSFFNSHLDDTWFRNLYSPAHKIQLLEGQVQRATEEANLMRDQIALPDFLEHVRLSNLQPTNQPPKYHLLSQQESHHWIQISKIPSHVTDLQIRQALTHDTQLHLVPTKTPFLERTMLATTPTALLRKTEDLVVYCTDPYNRTALDLDSRGNTSPEELESQKATLVLSSPSTPSHVVPLTHAVSHPQRIPGDLERARQLGRILDERLGLPVFVPPDTWAPSDQLDTYVAYLRRVHLMSFYAGLQGSVTEFLRGDSTAANTIYYRKSNDVNEELDPEDLLVQRLEENLHKIMEECRDTRFITDELREQAQTIAQSEARIQEQWLRDHSITDADGRARCSFDFCHKLFKDQSFLSKHLLKKHSEFLRAEQAKAHDEFMMAAWDAEGSRPVPELLVNCGSRLGFHPTTVTGSVPDCPDPEPELWKQEKARQESHMAQRREDVRGAHRPRAGGEFVDVDDMKEEKVEVKIDDIVPDATMKKKKKKRKLL